jgi:hypothetical protein
MQALATKRWLSRWRQSAGFPAALRRLPPAASSLRQSSVSARGEGGKSGAGRPRLGLAERELDGRADDDYRAMHHADGPRPSVDYCQNPRLTPGGTCVPAACSAPPPTLTSRHSSCACRVSRGRAGNTAQERVAHVAKAPTSWLRPPGHGLLVCLLLPLLCE